MPVKKTQEIERYKEPLPNGLDIELIKVPGGSFSRDEVQVKVPDFFLGKFPVTNQQYLSFVEKTESHHPKWMEAENEYNIYTGTNDHYKRFINNDQPVVGVSWRNAVAFCEWLSGRSGKSYRLPSEAEWEYAARGGQQSSGFRFAGSNNLKEVGWYEKNSHAVTKPVGLKLPNEFGLYDMSGNVWEWCADHWHDNYESPPNDGSTWVKVGDEELRVVRGGSWIDYVSSCTVSNRHRFDVDNRYYFIGYRIARY